jgi:hypothetical protein
MNWQFYWNPYFRERHVYFVPLPPPRCHELLLQSAKSWPVWSHGQIARTRTFTDRNDLWLYRATFWGHNGSKPYVRVRIRETPGGSNVEVMVTDWWLQQAAAMFLGFLTLTSFVGFISARSWQALYMALLWLGFLGVFLLMFAFGRLLARRDPERLLGYVRERLGIADAASTMPARLCLAATDGHERR